MQQVAYWVLDEKLADNHLLLMRPIAVCIFQHSMHTEAVFDMHAVACSAAGIIVWSSG